MSVQGAPLYVRALDLAIALGRAVEPWPPAALGSHGRPLLRAADRLLCEITVALAFPSRRGRSALAADLAAHRLRVRLRVAEGLGLLSAGAALAHQRELLAIGRMLGGWRKRIARAEAGHRPATARGAAGGGPSPSEARASGRLLEQHVLERPRGEAEQEPAREPEHERGPAPRPPPTRRRRSTPRPDPDP
jgi:hypothetical protein